MDVTAAFPEMGSYRGAAGLCGTTHKTVRRMVVAQQEARVLEGRQARPRNFDCVAELVAERVAKTQGRIRQSGCCRKPGPPAIGDQRGNHGDGRGAEQTTLV